MERLYCGPFMSSLDMHGLSLTLMRVTDDRLLAALDAPTQVNMPVPVPACACRPWMVGGCSQGLIRASPPLLSPSALSPGACLA